VRDGPNHGAADVILGPGATVHKSANVYGCEIGADSHVAAFVEIQRNVIVGDRCKISSHSFLCEGVTIEDEVFIGHHVCFTNDRLPRATNDVGQLLAYGEWRLESTVVKRRASVGSGSVILPGVVIGEGALVGAGSVVTRDVHAGDVVAGCPARVLRSAWPEPTE
jgi:UDP-2-acetamido-3-amino-2,3-dideoxy-glucuronate N-acetyltransferase